jgi:hypothetical protein
MMPQRNVAGVAIILSVMILSMMAWQAAPALAGFTPTPPPPPSLPVTDTPPPPPEKPPKDTPIPTAMVSLTTTPGVLPVAGGEASDQVDAEIIRLTIASTLILVAVGVIIRRMAGTRNEF